MATSLVTKKARKKMAEARADVKALPVVVGFAFGDMGADSSGNPKSIPSTASALNNELLRKPYTTKSFINETTCRYSCTLASTDLPGVSISEMGLYDSEGDLVCIKNFSPKGKDADLEITFQIDDIF